MKNVSFFLLTILGILFSTNSFAQKYGKSPEDSLQCIENISTYQEYFKQKNYASSYEAWKNVFTLCPKSTINTYIRGVTILKYMIENAKNSTEKNSYASELLNLYDLRSTYFGNQAQNNACKAIDMKIYYPDSINEIYHLLNMAVTTKKEDLAPVYIYNYFLASIEYARPGNTDTMLIIQNYYITLSLLELIIEENPYQKEEVTKYIDSIEVAFLPFINCSLLSDFFSKQLSENEEDFTLLKKISTSLENKGCINTALFSNVLEKLHDLKPNSRTNYLMGKTSLSKKHFHEAISHFNNALEIETFENSTDIYNTYLSLALAYKNLNQYANARSHANKAIETDSTKGDAYLFIAELYAQSATFCSEDTFQTKMVYCAALDKCLKAKSVDSSSYNISYANELINSYSLYFPNKEEVSVRGFKDGMLYEVPCWINETTTIRIKK